MHGSHVWLLASACSTSSLVTSAVECMCAIYKILLKQLTSCEAEPLDLQTQIVPEYSFLV